MQFDYNRIKDPTFFGEGRVKAHSDHVYYATRQDMIMKNNTFRESLNGLWKFWHSKNLAQAPKGFEKLDFDCKGWDDIHVPAHIQMEGYGKPQYANVQYPWDGHEQLMPGEVPIEFNPTANYVKYITIPEHMKGQRIFISFQGVESGFAFWCNGNYVGYSEDSFTPTEFEITSFLCEGENKLAAQVFRWTSGSWTEDQDFFRFSGIFRDVYLYSIPKIHVSDVSVRALLDDTYTEGTLELELRDILGDAKGATVDVELVNLTKVQDIELSSDKIILKASNPLLWSAEKPNLYDLYITVKDSEANVVEIIPIRVGFRRFEIKNGVMTINGKRIVFKGVNRHEFSSRNGRVPSEDELIKDLTTMKRNNINAIRTSHYPNDSRLYRLCDEYGIYLIAECNMETHSMWHLIVCKIWTVEQALPGDRQEWKDSLLDRVNSMYQRDKNHPAVLIWSCGNESFGGSVIYEMSQLFRKLDNTRLVHYEGVFNDRRYNDTSDIESQMYTHVNKIKEFLANDRSKPFILCEYTHAMGNSCGGMHKYTDLTEEEPLFQGGFIWDYIDQSIYKKDRYGKEMLGYGGDFDDRPCDYNFSGNGIAYGGEREESPKMQEVKYNYQGIHVVVSGDSFEVRNKNLFTASSEYKCVVSLSLDGKEIASKTVETDVEPMSNKSYKLPLWECASPWSDDDRYKAVTAGEYVVTVSFETTKDFVWAKAGHEVAFGQGVYNIAKSVAECKKTIKIADCIFNVGVKGDNFEVIFDKGGKGLTSYVYAGKEMFKDIPKPNFWRAPNDNDCGNQMPMRYAQWKIASLYQKNGGVTVKPYDKENATSFEITYKVVLATVPETTCDVTYHVTGDGKIKVTLTYDNNAEMTRFAKDMPEFGMIFKMDADYENLTWYGKGPKETYVDRERGGKLAIHKNKVADNMAEYLVPQECGNHTQVRYALVTDNKGRGLQFSACGDSKLSFSALPYTPHEIECATHSNELPPVFYTNVRVALMQMGVAGDDSWGARTHEEYLLDTTKPLKLEFSFCGI